MDVAEYVSLKPYNTMGVAVNARYFADVGSVNELQDLLRDPTYQTMPKFVLGGGSNLLFTGNFDGLVIYNDIKGISVVDEDEEHIWLKAYGGEVWHDLVEYCLEHDYAGIENLSLIPGKVGAAPMQNIGAYGVELEEVFDHLEAVRLADGEIVRFEREECAFGYRDSVFKNELKGKYCIVSVTLRLYKEPRFNVEYGAIRQTLDEMGVKSLSIQSISEAVCRIRRSKLPDPDQLGNAGSFFKNPYVSEQKFAKLKSEYPGIKGFPQDGRVKVPAGWLIEQCSYKGIRKNNTGTYKNQALIIVNYGGADSGDILSLAEEIQQAVKNKFDIQLAPEVNIV